MYKSSEELEEDYNYNHNWAVHNYIRHSIYIFSPYLLRGFIYDGGDYLGVKKHKDNHILSEELQTLELLHEMVKVSDGEEDNLFVYTNLVAHSYTELQLPDFTLSDNVDNIGLIDEMTDKDRFRGYCANAAAIRLIGKYMDQLRDLGVYDNTRITIVADHGFSAFAFPQMIYEGGTSFEQFNSHLLVKDFGEDAYTVSDELMSSADTCSIAMEGLIEKPIDPFNDRPAKVYRDDDEPILLTDAPEYENI